MHGGKGGLIRIIKKPEKQREIAERKRIRGKKGGGKERGKKKVNRRKEVRGRGNNTIRARE